MGAGHGDRGRLTSPYTAPMRGLRIARIVAAVLTVVPVLFVVLLVSATGTVLDDDYYAQSLEDAHAYDRFYTEILADPKFNAVTKDLTAQLPVDKSVVTANLRIVIPPATLHALVNSTIKSATQYLTAERKDIDLSVAVEPLVDNVKSLAATYLTDTVVNTPSFHAKNLTEFGSSFQQFLADVDAGRKPKLLPTIPLSGGTASAVVDTLVQNLPAAERAERQPQIETLIASGDLNGAVALAGVTHIQIGEQQREQLLTLKIGDDGQVDFTASVDALDQSGTGAVLKDARFYLGDVFPFVLLGMLVLSGAGLFVVGWTTRRLGGRPSRWIGWTLIALGAACAVIWVVGRAVAPDPLASVLSSSNRDMAPSVRDVLSDSWAHARDRLDQTVVGNAARVAFAGALVLLGAWIVPKLRRWWRTDRRRFWFVTVGTTIFVIGFFTLNIRIVIDAGADGRRCNGHAELCDRRFDQVAFAGSHNAMAAADRQYLSAMQDLTITEQLRQGVRALLMDAHYWEKPDDTNAFLASLPPETANGLRPLLAGANPVRPGAWWCHVLCRMGAEPLTQGFEEVADFVRTHPDEVVPIVVEDYVSRADIAKGVRDSGLEKYVFTPEDDPTFTWPTLGEMIDDDTRVVIFSEKNKELTKPDWYRNFYRYAMETPFDHKAPTQKAMSCRPNRGGKGKSLFLMNHWITRDTGSRADAGIVNQKRFILERARRCEETRGHMVNIVAVDFTTIGDVFGAVDALNGVRFTPG